MRAASLLLASLVALAGPASAETAGSAVEAFWPPEADTDNDDRISRDEAMILSEATFLRYDVDGGGSISPAEWRAVIDDRIAEARAQDPDVTGPADLEGFASKTFQTHDVDSDGGVSRAEWDSRVEAHFARLDRNGDGAIERDEAAGTVQGQKRGD